MNLCRHNQNPRTCVSCFHEPKAAAPRVPIQDDGIVSNLAGAPRGLVGKAPAPRVGKRDGAMIGVPRPPAEVDPAVRAKHRGELGRRAAPQDDDRPIPRGAFDNTHDPSAFDPNVLWEPKVRPQIIDLLPTHPSAIK